MPEVNHIVLLSQVINWIILSALLVAAFLVGRDARKKGTPWVETITWSALTLFAFPVGIGLYLLLGRGKLKTDACKRALGG